MPLTQHLDSGNFQGSIRKILKHLIYRFLSWSHLLEALAVRQQTLQLSKGRHFFLFVCFFYLKRHKPNTKKPSSSEPETHVSGHGLAGMVILGWLLDLMILEVFPSLCDSVMPALGFAQSSIKEDIIKGRLKKFTRLTSLQSFQIIFLCCYIYVLVTCWVCTACFGNLITVLCCGFPSLCRRKMWLLKLAW